MSNFRLFSPECVFVHIPKTGGTSIRRGVWGNKYEGPFFGEFPERWDGLFRFAFVRHPLERMISAWNMVRSTQDDPPSIEAFVDIVMDDEVPFGPTRRTEEERIRHHTLPQTHPFNCLDRVDFIGRHETFAQDFSKVAERLGVSDRKLPHMYAAQRKARWEDVLKGETLGRCMDYYQEDFELLEYKLPNRHPRRRAAIPAACETTLGGTG